jgi:hypothetical protein
MMAFAGAGAFRFSPVASYGTLFFSVMPFSQKPSDVEGAECVCPHCKGKWMTTRC